MFRVSEGIRREDTEARKNFSCDGVERKKKEIKKLIQGVTTQLTWTQEQTQSRKTGE